MAHGVEQGPRDHDVVAIDGSTWSAIDGRIDAVLSAIRDPNPNPSTEASVLGDLQTALN